MGEVGDCGGGDLATPTVLDIHWQSERYAKIARLAGTGQAAEAADFEIDHIHGAILVGPQ